MRGASSAFVSRGRCSEIAEPERGGYQGVVLYFYDLETGDVYQPFEKKSIHYVQVFGLYGQAVTTDLLVLLQRREYVLCKCVNRATHDCVCRGKI